MAEIPEPEYECGDAVEVLVDGVWRSAIIADGWYQEWVWIYAVSSPPGIPNPFSYLLPTSGQCRRA